LNAQELLDRLDALGIELQAQDGRLRVSAARGSLDDALKQAIGEHKAELLTLLAARTPGHLPALPHLPADGPLPLSLFQERLWILQQLEPQNTTYLLSASWRAPAGARQLADSR